MTARGDAAPRDAGDRWAAMHASFRWHVPADFDIATACCTRWAAADDGARRVAIVTDDGDGGVMPTTYAELHARADGLAHALTRLGVGRGDRVALLLPQRVETAVAHIAVYRVGAIAMPLALLFGRDALAMRLADSGAVLAVADAAALSALADAQRDAPALGTVVVVGDGGIGGNGEDGADGEHAAFADRCRIVAWHDALAGAPAAPYAAAKVGAEDPAVLIYTSGTTGPPKGALIAHRGLIGNLSGFVCSQNGFVAAREPAQTLRPLSLGKGERGKGGHRTAKGDQNTLRVFWSPADWAWTGGLLDALLPTLYFGQTIVASRARFDAAAAFALLQRHRVTHTFLFPTALKAMMKAVPRPRDGYELQLQAVMSAGEPVGTAVFDWCRDALGVTVNEMFGQTEINYIVGNCTGGLFDATGGRVAGWPARPGSMGRPYPGHRVAVIDDAGDVCPPGVAGDVAVHRRDVHGDRDPVFFIGYWRNADATAAKFTADPDDSWCRTGDTAVVDADGYFWYQGRSDDVFKVAGYRVGPSEIENCLVAHAAVANAAVVPKPDRDRGALVKAYVVLADGHVGDAALVAELQHHVRSRLAPYEYPKEIEFVDALPMTTTGKVRRNELRERERRRAAAEGRG